MARTFSGTYTTTQVLSNPSADNPATVTSTGLIDVNSGGASGILGTSGFAWTLTNLGTVESIGSGGAGITLESGGFVTNGAIGSTSALIDGNSLGVAILGSAGTVSNYGTIVSTQTTGGGAILLQAGGSVTNGASGSTSGLITGATNGVQINGSAGTVTNFGTIASTATGTVGGAVYLGAGGLIANYGLVIGARAPIGAGHGAAVTTVQTAATIRNLGTIASSATNASVGINLIHGGLIVNGAASATGALIMGSAYGIYAGGHLLSGGGTYSYPTGALATVVNYGTITGGAGFGVALVAGGTITNFGTIASTGGNAVYLRQGGAVTNQAGGTVTGSLNGISVHGSAGTVSNYGTIVSTQTNGDGVNLGTGGTVVNSGFIDAASFGVAAFSAAATVVNTGTILVAGTTQGTSVTINSGSINNHGLISGNSAVDIAGGMGTVSNYGTLSATGTGTFSAGINLQAGGTIAVTNQGTIIATGTGGWGINVNGGATITNGSAGNTAALISGYRSGVDAVGTAAVTTIVNFGTITGNGTGGSGLQLGGLATVTNFGAVSATNSGTAGIVNGTGINLGAGGTLTNLGTISVPSANNGTAISFGPAAGTVINGTAGSTAALVTAYHTGIGFFVGTAGSTGTAMITNFGMILSTQTGTAAGTGFTGWAVQMGTSATGVVSNFGTIGSAETNGGGAILLQAGGSVTNGASGSTAELIAVATTGVQVNGSAGTITNFGTIVSTTTGTTGQAIGLSAGGVITNYGLLVSDRATVLLGTATAHGGVISTTGTAATVRNFGTIETSGTNASQGINLLHGGLIVNGATNDTSALISASANGIYGGGHLLSTGVGYSYPGALVTLVNYGTIQATGTNSAVSIVAGGTVANRGLINGIASGISFNRTAGTVVNFGTVAFTGAGTSGEAVYLGAGGTVTNYGLISGARAGTSSANGYPGAVEGHNQPVTVRNFGTIANPNFSNGVNLLDGGTIFNGATNITGATISGVRGGIYVGGTLGTPTSGAVGLVFNYGTIANASTAGQAVRLVSGGSVTNHGLISSARTGISFGNAAGTIANFGTVVSTAPTSFTLGAGVYLQNGGLITNAAGGLITALKAAVSIGNTTTTSASVTFSNAGTITGSPGVAIGAFDTGNNTIVNSGKIVGTSGMAIELGAGNDQVVIEPGSMLQGAVGNFHPGDTFDRPSMLFSSTGTATLGAGNVLQIVENGGTFTINLDPAQNFTGNFFHLANDGSNGTLVTENEALIANGSFETPTVTVGGFQDFAVGSALLTGWTVFGPSGTNVSIVSGSFAQNGVAFPAEDGTQWLDLTGDGSNSTEGVSQTVATVAGDRYQITYFVGNTTGGGIFGTTSTVDLSLNGAPTFTDTNSNVSPTTQNWQQFTHTFVANGTSTALAFQNGDPAGDNNNGLDNIALTDLGPATLPGSKLAFFAGVQTVNIGLTTDGTTVPAAVAGDFNIEVFTSIAGALASGYQASAFVPGAAAISGDNNEILGGTPSEQLLDGSYLVIDRTGNEALQIAGSAAGGSSTTVIGSSGDTITGSALAGNAQLIEAIPNSDAVAGPMTVIGGAGATTVWGGANDSITGGAGAILVDGHLGASDTVAGGTGTMTVQGAAGDSILGGAGALLVNENQGNQGLENIAGGAGSLTAFDLGRNDTIGGSTGGTTSIDDSYGSGGFSHITGGSGTTGTLADGENTFIKAAAGDTVTGGTDLTLINATGGGANVQGGSGTVTGTIADLKVAVNTAIEGGGGDTITGGAGATYIDANVIGPETIAGGVGATTVEAGLGEVITGGAGALQVVDSYLPSLPLDPPTGGFNTITGGAGNLTAFSIGTFNTVTGSTAGTTFVNDTYTKAGKAFGGSSLITGGSGTVTGASNPAGGGPIGANTWVIGQVGDTVVGGSGNIYVDASSGSESVTGGSSTVNVTIPSLETASGGSAIQGGALDTIVGGSGTLQLYINSNVGAETVNLGAGHGAAALRDIDVGAAGAGTSVSGFSTASDAIQSRTSVDAQNVFLGTSQSDGHGGTILSFVDGSTMTLAGVASVGAIKFTQ